MRLIVHEGSGFLVVVPDAELNRWKTQQSP